jgi:hypothetical protein
MEGVLTGAYVRALVLCSGIDGRRQAAVSRTNKAQGIISEVRTRKGPMTRQGRLGDRSHSRQHRTYSDRDRAGDWTNPVVGALVLTIAVLVATIAIAVYDNSALLASRHDTTTSEPPATGMPETLRLPCDT